MKSFLSKAACAGFLLLSATGSGIAADPSTPPSVSMIDQAFIAKVREWSNSNVVHFTLSERNKKNASIDQAKIDALDKQWREERKSDDQPLITAVLSSPLSGYLTRIQARSLGLYSELFVMDNKGLNAGQSAITSDYWQGDEDKWQKTFLVGPDAVLVDKVEFDESSQMFQSQVSVTVVDPATGQPIGAITVGVNVENLDK